MRKRAPASDSGSTREAITKSLVQLGFAPVEQPSSSPERTTLDLTRCPFSDPVTASANGRQICELHHGLLAGIAIAAGGALDEFVINDPRAFPCRVAFHTVGQETQVPP